MDHGASFALTALFAWSIAGCTTSPSGADACITSGGQCVFGSATASCAKPGSSDCGSGAVCCLEFLDGADEQGNAMRFPDANTTE